MAPQLPLLVLALAFTTLPSSVNAGLFPKKSNVKHIDANAFENALKEERTFVTAFVAPWCGHCQKLVPELTRTADGLHPLVPVYAVDCDDEKNKRLCATQGVKGFPTIKLYPEGTKTPPLEFDGTRTASSLFYWASRAVPGKMSRSQNAQGVKDIVRKNPGKPKAILMNKSSKTPLLWRVLSNKYSDKIVFGNCRDRKGKESVKLGFEAGEQSKQKVLIYGPEDTEPILYEGSMKYASLSEFFDQVIEGSVDISRASLNAKQEVLKVPESEREALDDETKIGDGSYGGFNPHEGLDLDELMKGLKNPFNHHGAVHPGGGKAHSAEHGRAKVAQDSASKKSAISSSTSSEAVPSFSTVETTETKDSATESKESFATSSSQLSDSKNAATAAEPVTAEKPVEAVESPTKAVAEAAEPTTDHTKDEL
ncbi:hypothetical protein K439DRAFT_1632696 [Ramaria rubella]|nr:hypothetical protein K439DRAFT_1632696 [Ramaria rubella]